MSNSLWFAEGFTSYYTNLILERAGIITAEEYVKGLNGTFNYVWNSPALQFFNPIEMSNQAPFVDAATAVDPVNRENMFISYYSYGSVLGLALDLSLREKNLNLDDFMKLMWSTYGKNEVGYEVSDIEKTLSTYAGKEFSEDFFNNYIYASQIPDYETLFEQVGLTMERDSSKAFFGATLRNTENGVEVVRNTTIGSPAYVAGLDNGDIITSVNGTAVNDKETFNNMIDSKNVGDKITIEYVRFGKLKTTTAILLADPTYHITVDKDAKKTILKARESWLSKK